MRKIILTTTLAILALCSFAQETITGVWYNTTKSGKIEIYENGGEIYGKIVWLEEPNDDKTGKPKVDENNPEKELQNKPIIGLVMLKNFEKDGDNQYTGGTVYDPENGKTYKCKMTLVSPNELDVRGYVGIPAFGRTENWTRVN